MSAMLERLLSGSPSRSDDPRPLRSVEVVTPEIAEVLLTRRQRALARENPKAIRQYAESMSAGDWAFNGMPIIFSTEQVLLDGLQRLRACVLSGKPFPTFFCQNI